MTVAPPLFCPWCGSRISFEKHDREPRFTTLADQARARGESTPPLPERVQKVLSGESYVGACRECRTVSHVVGHRPPPPP
jgi:hypothetical protein